MASMLCAPPPRRRQGPAPLRQRQRRLPRIRHVAARRPRRQHRRPSPPHRICPFLEKKTNRANKVSFSNQKTKKQQFVNLQYKKLWWEAAKRYVKLRLSTKALKTVEKHRLDTIAKKARIDLNKK